MNDTIKSSSQRSLQLLSFSLSLSRPQKVVSWTPEASWRTKSAVHFNWGYFSPEAGVDHFGASPSFVSNSNTTTATTSNKNDTEDSWSPSPDSSDFASAWNSSSLLFPVDYFSARFTGFGKPFPRGWGRHILSWSVMAANGC